MAVDTQKMMATVEVIEAWVYAIDEH